MHDHMHRIYGEKANKGQSFIKFTYYSQGCNIKLTYLYNE